MTPHPLSWTASNRPPPRDHPGRGRHAGARPRPLRRRRRAARPAPMGSSCARRTPSRASSRSTPTRRARSTGVIAVLTARRHEGGRRRQRVDAFPDGGARRRQARGAVPAGARRGPRHACRPGGRAGGREYAGGRAGRGREGRGRLRRARSRSSMRPRPSSRARPQLWPEAAGNIGLDWVGLAKDPDANAREIDEIIKSAAHVARLTAFQPAHLPGHHGDARRDRELRQDERRLYAAHLLAERRA